MPAPFLEIQFPPAISYGVRGGPRFSTDVAQVDSGDESRNINWPLPLHEWDAAKGMQTQAQMDEVRAFFWIVYGMACGFRWKDWDDYQVTLASGRINADGLGDGLPSGQLYKRYAFGAQSRMRPIRKPTGTPVLYQNDAPLATPADYTLDATTGEVAWVPSLTQAVDANVVRAVDANVVKTISGITQANPGVVTATAHGFATGDVVKIAGVAGMTQVNDLYFTVTNLTADTFSIGVNTTAYGVYTSGGTVTRYGISQTNPVRVRATAHGFATGDKIRLASAGGMTQVNNLTFGITVVDADTFTLGVNGTAYTAYTAGATATRHGISNTSPARVLAAAHGLTNGQIVYLAGVAGMTQVNGLTFTVANAAADSFELSGIDATAYGTYTGGASAYLYPQPGDTLKWVGEFDVPVRFDTDTLQVSIEHYNGLSWGQIPIVEIRV